MIIREMTPLSYKITMTELRSPLADSNLTGDGIGILGCFDSECVPLGFAMYRDYEKTCSILHIEFTENREQILTALIGEIRRRCEEKRLEKIFWNTELDFVPDGFTEELCDRLYRVGEAEKPLWEKFKVRIEPVLKRAERSGLLTVPLSSCTKEQLGQIKKLYRTEHDCSYMERILDNEDGKLLGDMSFVTLCRDDIASFCIFSESDEHGCMLKYLYARPDFRSTAAMLHPLSHSIDAFLESSYINLRWTIRSGNRYSQNFVARHFPEIQPRLSIHNYVLTKGD